MGPVVLLARRYLLTKTLIMDTSPNDPFPAYTTIENKLTIFVFTPMWWNIRPSFHVKYVRNGLRITSFKFVNQRFGVGRFGNFRTDQFVRSQYARLRYESRLTSSGKWIFHKIGISEYPLDEAKVS